MADDELRLAMKKMVQQRALEMKDSQILPSAKKLLKSLVKHWEGLTVFVDHPQWSIPVKNNLE